MYDLIVIGAGPGGYESAAYAARLGKKVALVEKENLGGTCLNVGCIPTKTLLRSAKSLSDCLHAADYGVDVEGTPKLDMKKAQARKNKLIATLRKGIATMLKKAKVDVIEGLGSVKASGKVEVNGEIYETKNILIATGSTPAVPPIPGIDSDKVLTSTGILDLDEIPESLVVIGGGVIGLEFACFFAELGTKVTVVEMMSKIAPVIDEEIAKRLQQGLKRAGVKFNLECRVVGIEGNTLKFLNKKGEEETVDGSYILNSTGRAPVMQGLGLDEAGIDYERRGIKADDFCRTNLPNVYACGDVTGRCQLAHAATREGFVAVHNMFGIEDRMRYSAIPSVVYTHPEVASVGATEQQLKDAGIDYRKVVMPMAVAGRFMVEYAGQSGTVKVLVGNEYDQVLGVHMIGGCCGEFIASAAAMVETEMRVKDVREIVFPHPTVSEALRETILHA